MSVVIGAIEIVSTYEQHINYYLDDNMPEETAFKEAMLDAVVSGLHDGFSNYAKGLDDLCDEEFFRLTRRKREGVVSYSERAATTSDGKITVTCRIYQQTLRNVERNFCHSQRRQISRKAQRGRKSCNRFGSRS